jgi:hypothetical protein
MLNYLSQLQAHKVKDTVSVNDVRRKILDLTKPLAEIARKIDVSIAVFEDTKKEIETDEKTAEEIKAAISIDIPTLEAVPLNHPRTVCTSPSCSESHVLNGQNVKQFTTFCHDHCYLSGITVDVINTPELKQCWAMEPSGGERCRTCDCSWNVHMHVTYDLVSVTKPGEDANARERYQNVTSATQMKQLAIAELENTIQELEYERNQIMEASAQFGLFLKKNSLLPYNDAMLGYLDYIIKQEKEKAAVSKDNTQVEAMVDLKLRYEHEVQALKKSLNVLNDESLSTRCQEDIIQHLYQMKHFGDNLKGIFQSLSLLRTNKIHLEEVAYTTQRKEGKKKKEKKNGIVRLYQYVKKLPSRTSSRQEGMRQEPVDELAMDAQYLLTDFNPSATPSSSYGHGGARSKQRFQQR